MYYYFIVNKSAKSGRSSELWDKIEATLVSKGVSFEVHFTEREGHAKELAYEGSIRGGDTCICVMGGDGTLNEVLNGIDDFSKVEIGYIPSGSANDFAKGIGLTGDYEAILNRILDESYETHVYDLGEVSYDGGKHIFGVSAGIGVDAYVCLQALDSKLKKFLNIFHMGQASYALLTVGDIFTMPLGTCDVSFEDKSVRMKNTIFIAAMNCPYEGGGIPMVPYANADSGHLSAFMAHDISRLRCFGILPKLVAGKHVGVKGVDFADFQEMTVKLDRAMCVHADGEHCGFHTTVTFKCLPKMLKLRGV